MNNWKCWFKHKYKRLYEKTCMVEYTTSSHIQGSFDGNSLVVLEKCERCGEQRAYVKTSSGQTYGIDVGFFRTSLWKLGEKI